MRKITYINFGLYSETPLEAGYLTNYGKISSLHFEISGAVLREASMSLTR